MSRVSTEDGAVYVWTQTENFPAGFVNYPVTKRIVKPVKCFLLMQKSWRKARDVEVDGVEELHPSKTASPSPLSEEKRQGTEA